MEEDYEYTGANSRKDETHEFALGMNYELRRWVDVGMGYKYQDVESNNGVPADTYDRNIFMLKLTMGL
jgi:predicted porin